MRSNGALGAPGRLGARSLVVTGGTGFVGKGLLAWLAPSWHGEIRAWTRRLHADLPTGVRVERVDLRDREAVARAMPVGSAVVHLAYTRTGQPEENLAMARNLAEACLRRSAERLVHVSTALVVGRASEKWVTETTPCRPVDEYQRTKLEIEVTLERLTAGRVPLVVLRPSAVLGWEGTNLRKLVSDLRYGSRVVNYLRSSLYGRRAMHLVPLETVAAAIEFALRNPQPLAANLYLVTEDEAPENTFCELERRLLAALGGRDYPVPPLHLPPWCLETLLHLTRRMVLRPVTRFSSGRLRAAGFNPPVTLDVALERYARRAAAALAA